MIYKILLCACTIICNAQEVHNEFLRIKQKYDHNVQPNLKGKLISSNKTEIIDFFLKDINVLIKKNDISDLVINKYFYLTAILFFVVCIESLYVFYLYSKPQ